MRRFAAILMILLTCMGGRFALAQEPTAEPETVDEAVERAIAAAERAEDAAEDARNAENTASNLLGIFEAVGVLIGIVTGVVIPAIAVVGVSSAFARLNSAESELKEKGELLNQQVEESQRLFREEISKKERELDEVKRQFQDELVKKEQDLDQMKLQLSESAQETRQRSQNAIMAQALLPLGERQYRAQDYQGAVDTYTRALQMDDVNPMIHYRLGYVYVQSGNLTKAEVHLKRALDIFPDFAPAMAALGYVYRRMGEKMDKGIQRDTMLNKAEQHLLAALNLQPKLIDEDNESWYGSLGGLYRRRGQIQQAIDAYRQAGEVTPHSSYPYSNLALLYMDLGDRDKMLRTYRRVERLAASEVMAEVGNYWGYADLVVARLALGKVAEAEALLETTISAAPMDSPYMLESLADTLERLGGSLPSEDRPAVQRAVEFLRKEVERRKQLIADGKTTTEE